MINSENEQPVDGSRRESERPAVLDSRVPSLDSGSAAAGLEFARLIGRLKTTPRTGWVRRGVPRYESVADHSWRVSALAFLLQDTTDVDLSKCLSLAVVHDMAECLVGDIAPDDCVNKQDKQRMEHQAMDKISLALQKATTMTDRSSALMNLFQEYEKRESAESKVVKDLDLLDMIVQADEYEHVYGIDLTDFFVSTPPERFHNERLRRIAQEVHTQRSLRREREGKDEEFTLDGTSAKLSKKDAAFVEEFCQATKMNRAQVETVLKALRGWEDRS